MISKLSKNNKGQRLWKKAISIIPGGNGLLSKRPERYVPDLWPIYFLKAKGSYVWDLEGNKYIDMAQNGIGSAILGYADKDVDKAVTDIIKKGINTTLNPPEEYELAKYLLDINPGMSLVKFARGGGEAMSIAVRIARAKSKFDKVLFSGYHGWNDWYIAANVSTRSNLDEHLIAGLNPIGVPVALKNSAIPFLYNDCEDFIEKLKKNEDCAAVVIEGARYYGPDKKFVKLIEKETKKRNITFIVDDITSGFRIGPSGTYLDYGYKPDMIVYGKALGNGYAISAILGTKKSMSVASETFISSTMWTERVGFAAALACLRKINKLKIYKHLIKTGKDISIIWKRLSIKHNINLSVSNFYPLVTFKFKYPKIENLLLTLFIQEMLRRGFLASNSVYVTYTHTPIILRRYEKSCDEVFFLLRKSIDNNNLEKMLKSKARFDSFARLNK